MKILSTEYIKQPVLPLKRVEFESTGYARCKLAYGGTGASYIEFFIQDKVASFNKSDLNELIEMLKNFEEQL